MTSKPAWWERPWRILPVLGLGALTIWVAVWVPSLASPGIVLAAIGFLPIAVMDGHEPITWGDGAKIATLVVLFLAPQYYGVFGSDFHFHVNLFRQEIDSALALTARISLAVLVPLESYRAASWLREAASSRSEGATGPP